MPLWAAQSRSGWMTQKLLHSITLQQNATFHETLFCASSSLPLSADMILALIKSLTTR